LPRSAKALARAARLWDGETVLPEVVVARGSVADSALLTADDVDVLAVPVAPAPEEGDGLEPRAGTVDAAVRYGIDLAELAERGRATGAPGDAHVVDLPRAHGRREMPWTGLPERVILLGVGDGTPTDLRKAGAALARATRGASRVLTPVAGHGGAESAAAFVEGYALAAYRTPSGQTGSPEPGPADQLVLLGEHPESAVVDALRAARATWLTRDLTNAPANIKDPAWFAARPTASAGSWRSAPARRANRASSPSRTTPWDPTASRTATRATWSWSARASRTTRAGSRSSPVRRWSP
jgi:leucyl aminopeptidase